MYKITRETGPSLLTEAPTYIKRGASGCFVLCPEAQAAGIVHNGVPYHLLGRPELPGTETVKLLPVDGGSQVEQAASAGHLAFVALAEAGTLDPVTAGEHESLFAEWAWPVSYKTGQIRRFGGALYQCLTAHESQETWTPPDAASLWVKIANPSEEWPPWAQPIGAMDAYPLGARVRHKGEHWTSAVENNVWEPGVFGWEAESNG